MNEYDSSKTKYSMEFPVKTHYYTTKNVGFDLLG